MLDIFADKSLLVIITIFILSLLGAFVLFRFLKSTAGIENKKFQAGGALAGFIILYFTMFQSYEKLQDMDKIKEKLGQVQKLMESLQEKLKSSQINGTVMPPAKNVKIVLAVKQTDPDDNGQFRLSANCIDPQLDDIKLFVISENGYKFKNIFSKEEMNGITIRTR